MLEAEDTYRLAVDAVSERCAFENTGYSLLRAYLIEGDGSLIAPRLNLGFIVDSIPTLSGNEIEDTREIFVLEGHRDRLVWCLRKGFCRFSQCEG